MIEISIFPTIDEDRTTLPLPVLDDWRITSASDLRNGYDSVYATIQLLLACVTLAPKCATARTDLERYAGMAGSF